jgi:CubicO group peptidase (beta-lactamase class C family)
MTWRHYFAVAAAAAVIASAPSVASASASTEHETIRGASPEPIVEGAGLRTREDLEAFFDGIMAAHLAAQRTAGATVSVVKDGELFFTKGYRSTRNERCFASARPASSLPGRRSCSWWNRARSTSTPTSTPT